MATANSPLQDAIMGDDDRETKSVAGEADEPKFGGFSRFEIELEVCWGS